MDPLHDLATERLRLSPLTTDRAGDLAPVLADPELYGFIGNAPTGVAAVRDRYRRMARGSTDPEVVWGNWLLELRQPPTARPLDTDPRSGTAPPPGTDRRSDGAADPDPAGPTGPVVGTVQATIGPGPVAEIAWMVGLPWQGRGYAKEAARALAAALTRRGVREITAHVHPDHHASAAVARAAGLNPTDERQDGEVRWRRALDAAADQPPRGCPEETPPG